MKVPKKDAELLATFYEGPVYKAYKRLLERRRTQLLEASLSATTMEDVRYYRGGTDHLDWEQKTLKEIHKAAGKAEEDVEDAENR